MSSKKNMISFDCGNSSFRVVLGSYDGKQIKTEVVEQIPNEMTEIDGYFYWDILMIYQGLLKGLKKAVQMVDKVDSIGICTWGVDFAMYDSNKFMLGNPLSYRNAIGTKCLEQMSEKEKAQMFAYSGILCDKINSCYMLKGMKEAFPKAVEAADKVLMIPDILNYLFTGKMLNEPSELSTTQLMDVRNKKISKEACEMLGIRPELFGEIGQHGTRIGNLRTEIKEQININYDIPVICVPSHDTAAAVLAVPAEEEEFAFISSGTWALIGTELSEPIINDAVRESGLTNEAGAFDRITLLKNSAGMFLVQRLRQEYEQTEKTSIGWEELNALGDECQGRIPLFPVNNPRFFNPIHMGEEIWKYFQETGQEKGKLDWKIIIRSFQESMACSYAETIGRIEELQKSTITAVYIVGGGSANVRICQKAADCMGKKVIAGGKESTSLGNILAQIAYFEPEKTIKELRRIVHNSIVIKEYKYQENKKEMAERYQQLP